MPFIVTPEGKVLAQSGAIMKYICKQGGTVLKLSSDTPPPPQLGGCFPIYRLYRYVPRDRVWFMRFLILNKVSFLPLLAWCPIVLSLDRVANQPLAARDLEATLDQCFTMCIHASNLY